MDSTRYIRMSHKRINTPPPSQQVVHQNVAHPAVVDHFGNQETVVHRRQDFNRVFESPTSSVGDVELVEETFDHTPSPIHGSHTKLQYPPV